MIEAWKGKFGDEYVARNRKQGLYAKRRMFWKGIEKEYKPKRVLEIGCGTGHNLDCFLESETYGCDVNETALRLAWEPPVYVIYGEAEDVPYRCNFSDFVMCCGLLIHLDSAAVLKTMKEMVRCSSEYVFIGEYESEKEEKIEYRDGVDLFKRPYGAIFINHFPKWKLVNSGELTPEEGFDFVTWHLFERTK